MTMQQTKAPFYVVAPAGPMSIRLPCLLDALKRENPPAYEQLMIPAAGFPAVPAYAMESLSSPWWETEAAHQLADEIIDRLECDADDVPYRILKRLDDGALAYVPDMELAYQTLTVWDSAEWLPEAKRQGYTELLVNDGHATLTLFTLEDDQWQMHWSIM